MTRRNMTFASPVAIRNIGRIIELISEEKLTEPEIAERLSMSQYNVKMYLNHLRSIGEIHICGWTRKPICGQRSFPRPQFKIGNYADAKKPTRKSKAAIAKAYRKRIYADPESHLSGYRKLMRNRTIQTLRLQTLRRAQLIEHGYLNPMGMGEMTVRVAIGEKRRSPTPAQVVEIIELREAGVYWKDIEKKVGVPKSTARDYYKRMMG